MAKGQKRSNKETRKPKQTVAKPATAQPLFKSFPPTGR
jgi:hypothetical protein